MTNLPAEVLYNVFAFSKESDSQRSLYNYSLVCKIWNQPAQHLLYSKVAFYKRSKLDKFVETIKNNNQLADIVKEVYLSIPPLYVVFSHNTSGAKFLPFADLFNYLPNLEILGSKYEMNYLSLLDALSNSKLLKLKMINVLALDKVDYDLYATCMMFMKNRVESLAIADKKTISDLRKRSNRDLFDLTERDLESILYGKERFKRLYDNIHLFTQLREVFLTTYTDDPIGILEQATGKCPNLHTVRFDFAKEDHKPWTTYSYNVVNNYSPTPNIKTLHGIEIQYCMPQFIPYIMHKFPQLDQLYLDTKTVDVSLTVEGETAMKLIDYMSTINTVTFYGLCLNGSDFNDTIRYFWRDPSNRAIDHFEIEYIDGFDETVIVDVMKNNTTRNNKIRNHLGVQFDRQSGNLLQHVQMIEEFGERFKALVFSRSRMHLPSDTSTHAMETYHGNFIDHILCHCPNLLDLRIIRCQLKKIDFSNFHQTNQRLKFRTLIISDSKLNSNIFEEMSTVFKSITHFKLAKNLYCFVEDKPEFNADIMMMNTAIRTLTIDISNQRSQRVFLKICTSLSKEYRYYKYTFRSGKNGFEPCHENEHKESIGSFIIHIRCRILNNLEIIRGDETTSLSPIN